MRSALNSISECEQGTISHNGQCVPCPQTCTRCLEKKDFLVCQSKEVFYDGSCSQSCPTNKFLFYDEACNQNICIDPPVSLNLTKTEIIVNSSTSKTYNNSQPDFFLLEHPNTKAFLVSGIILSAHHISTTQETTVMMIYRKNGTRLANIKLSPLRRNISWSSGYLEILSKFKEDRIASISILLTSTSLKFQDHFYSSWYQQALQIPIEEGLILSLGGSLGESFIGELSSVIVKSFPEIPTLESLIGYGVEKILLEKFFLSDEKNQTTPKIFSRDDSFTLNITPTGIMTKVAMGIS